MIIWEHGTIGEYLPPDAGPVEEWGPDIPCLHMEDTVMDLFVVIPYEEKIFEIFGDERGEMMILSEGRKILAQAQARHVREHETDAARNAAEEDSEEELFHVDYPINGRRSRKSED